MEWGSPKTQNEIVKEAGQMAQDIISGKRSNPYQFGHLEHKAVDEWVGDRPVLRPMPPEKNASGVTILPEEDHLWDSSY